MIGAVIGLYAGASQRVISFVMAVGAGVLISSVAFELMEESYREGGFDTPAIGLLLGAVLYFAADSAVTGGPRTASAPGASKREARARRSPWGR